MEKEKFKKLSIDFPADEYIYLKMACAKQGISIKEFVTKAIVKTIEDYEDELDVKSLSQARKEIIETGVITWEEMIKKLGWDKL